MGQKAKGKRFLLLKHSFFSFWSFSLQKKQNQSLYLKPFLIIKNKHSKFVKDIRKWSLLVPLSFTQREFRKCCAKTPQMDPTYKSVIATLKFPLIFPKMLDGDQTSSNIIQHDFFLLFVFFVNLFRHLKCIQPFIQHTKYLMLVVQ